MRNVACPDAPCCEERPCLHLAPLTSREADRAPVPRIRASNASERHRRREVIGVPGPVWPEWRRVPSRPVDDHADEPSGRLCHDWRSVAHRRETEVGGLCRRTDVRRSRTRGHRRLGPTNHPPNKTWPRSLFVGRTVARLSGCALVATNRSRMISASIMHSSPVDPFGSEADRPSDRSDVPIQI